MEFENITLEKYGPIATVTINRPKVLNALNRKTIEELECVFFEIKQDAEVRVVILTGAGGKAFVAGADINEVQEYDAASGAKFALKGQAVLNLMENLGKPIIAAINGFALGGGLEIAMACHIRIASKNAQVGQPEINLGIIPGFGGTQRLARLVGEGRAMELVLVGNSISADEAKEMGLVNHVVEQDDLLDKAREMAQKLSKKSSLITRYAMEAVHRGLQGTLAEGLNQEATLFGLCCATEDKKEGTVAFVEKRRPEFKDK
jgi:enoyl-CoA hydratase